MAAIRLTRLELHQRVWAQPMARAARDLGLSAGGLAKICDRLLIPYPKRGHWSRAERSLSAPLLAAPDLDAMPVVIGDDRAASRRPRTRLAPSARRDQLLAVARAIVAGEGVGPVSMRRIAREAGVSEALAFSYFGARAEILAELARRELAAVADDRQAEIALGRGPRDRVARSIVAYLRQIEARGSVLHALLTAPEVRTLLRAERQSARTRNTAAVSARFTDAQGVPADFARGATLALSAASRRAGALIATGRVSRADVEPLVLAMVEGANRTLAANS